MHTRYLPAAVAAAVFGASAHTHAAFPFDDIQFWVGEGTNQAAVVIDWGHDDPAPPAVRVWGYRWNGEATAGDAILAIDEADPRLDVAYSQSGYGLLLTGFTYYLPEGGSYEAVAEDTYDATSSWGTYWSLSSASPNGEMASATVGASSLALEPGGRVGLKWTYYTFDYVTYDYDGGDMSVAEVAAVAAPPPEFTFDDIHYWVGIGTNRASLVVDFSRDGYAPRAWGYRWNGDATAADALLAIVHDDNRLHALTGDTGFGLSLYALGYDRSDIAAAFRFDYNGGYVVAESSDADAFAGGGWYNGYWSQWTAPEGSSLDASSLDYGNGLSATPLANDSWHVLQFSPPEWGWDSYPLAGVPLPAESPYGWRVVAADVKAVGVYGNVTNALGHPSLSVPEWKQQNVPPTPATPAAAAWGADVIVSLTSATNSDAGGSITIAFDHPVIDDPRNPFGLDFLVFGNSLHQIAAGGGNGVVGSADPSTVVFQTGTGTPEPGLVEVSQDGVTWFAFRDGPYADSFAPTLSHLYDPANADTNLFAGNVWWGATADATRPVDPAVSFANFKGKSLAEYATLYDGSAGGTGFDIAAFDLPTDAHGRKWIRFVRVTSIDPADVTEVDAIADVSPAPSFRNWVDTHVAFADRPGYAKSTVCANGAPAFVNAAFGVAPDDPAPGAWAIEGFDGDTRTLTAPFAPFAYDLVTLRSSTNLTDAVWSASLPLWTGTNELGRALLRSQTPAGSTEFFRLEVHE